MRAMHNVNSILSEFQSPSQQLLIVVVGHPLYIYIQSRNDVYDEFEKTSTEVTTSFAS